RSVAQKPASCCHITLWISRRHPVVRGQGDKLHGTADEKPVWSDEQGVGPLACKAGKGRINLADRRGVDDLDLQPKSVSGFLDDVQCGLGIGNIGRVNKYGNANNLGHQVVQEPQPLGYYLSYKKIDPRRIAAGPSEVGDKPKPDRVFWNAEDDRDRCRCS